jgi:hypothetical protein
MTRDLNLIPTFHLVQKREQLRLNLGCGHFSGHMDIIADIFYQADR